MSRYWFKPKQFGLGASPSTWEGWVSIAVFMGVLVGITTLFPPDRRPMPFFGITAIATLAYIWLCWIKTEGGWHWRWGGDK